MSDSKKQQQKLPEEIAEIEACGFVTWSTTDDLSPEFKRNFDDVRIPVIGIRNVRLWGVQVDDEREIAGHERTSIPDEELWEIVLQAKDGSNYEVNAKFVVPAPG